MQEKQVVVVVVTKFYLFIYLFIYLWPLWKELFHMPGDFYYFVLFCFLCFFYFYRFYFNLFKDFDNDLFFLRILLKSR